MAGGKIGPAQRGSDNLDSSGSRSPRRSPIRWMADQDERLQTAIAAERVMLAGSDVGDMLNQAESRWREAEAERLKAAEERWKMEEDRRVAAAVGSAHEDMERMVEARLHRELAVDARRLLGRLGAVL